MVRTYHRPGVAEDRRRSRLGVGCLAEGLAVSLLVGAAGWLVFRPEEILFPRHLVFHPPLSQPVRVLYGVVHFLAFIIFPTAVWAACRRWHEVSVPSQRKAAGILGACFLGLLGWEIALRTLLPEVRKVVPPLLPGGRGVEVQVSAGGMAVHFSPLWKVLWFAGLVLTSMVVGYALGCLGSALARPLRLGRREDQEQAAAGSRPSAQLWAAPQFRVNPTWPALTAVLVGIASETAALVLFFYGLDPYFDRSLRHVIWAGHLPLTAKLLWTGALLLGFPSLCAYLAYRVAPYCRWEG